MKRQSRGAAFDLSIRGDELEHDRIQLEHNLQNTEISFRLSSTSDEESDHNYNTSRSRRRHPHDSSVEYPRHLSEPSMAEFPSFVHRSRDFGDEDRSHVHGWSADDDEGINPYGGHSISTAAHHASALTISAGLGGGRGARRDPSLSGAEYDPDRPLHAMIAGVNSKQHSMFDLDHTKTPTAGITYDPLVVDSTAELDRILESGHAPPPPIRSLRPLSPISSSSPSTSDSENRPRPKLSDHLRHVSFSPKRPRSVQLSPSKLASPLNRPNHGQSMNAPTPRARRVSSSMRLISTRRSNNSFQPEVRLHPATPSTGGSKFTRMARGINKELEETQQQLVNRKQTTRPSSAPIERNPFQDTAFKPEPVTHNPGSTPRRSNIRSDTTNGKIHLPDVTGLTAAVESPMRPGMEYYPYKADARPRDIEVRLLQTLTAVQSQLRHLQDQNDISRRRVRELEMELDTCKLDVTRERTRLYEREKVNTQYYPESSYRGNKGKEKAREDPSEVDATRLHARYKEAVDEKKALEALISSLRSHLTRLTSELASHQELLTELRKLRDSDAHALREKSTEILQLREEVQRLAGEVEVLRGVVEEGLKERRASREVHGENEEADIAMSQDLAEETEEEDEDEDERLDHEDDEAEEDDDYSPETDVSEPEPFDPESLRQSSPPLRADRTMRTDHATLGSSGLGQPSNSPRVVNDDELSQIAAELDERRSNRSNGSTRRRSTSPIAPGLARRNMRATVEDEDEDERGQVRPQQQQPAYSQSSQQQQQQQSESSTSRPSAPTPGHATRQYGRVDHRDDVELETPFPQIRGAQLERLFFSAPEHNAKTCTVCYRRRHRRGNNASSSPWAHPARTSANEPQNGDEDDDEGYEGSDDAEIERPASVPGGSRNAHASLNDRQMPEQFSVVFSTDPAHWQAVGERQGLPPQTVVARVVRELEDDFTHYKSIYVELADQYKVMDAASDVARRNTLAKHLREVVDILEQKGDQIASLYDLLRFKEKSLPESILPEKAQTESRPVSIWGRTTSSSRR